MEDVAEISGVVAFEDHVDIELALQERQFGRLQGCPSFLVLV
jgi:hypothetical protein